MRGALPASPSGGVHTTLAATASWPSRKTVAVIGRVSPTTARANTDRHDTTEATSVMRRRRSGRPVIAATLEGPSCPPPLRSGLVPEARPERASGEEDEVLPPAGAPPTVRSRGGPDDRSR